MILSNYWNSALRSLTKKKGFSAINIIGLAIGMAAALLILTYVAFEYSYDNMHSRADRIFRVEARFYENGELTDNWASSSAGYATAMKRNLAGVEDYTRVGSQYYPEQVVKYNELLYRETGIGYAEKNDWEDTDFPQQYRRRGVRSDRHHERYARQFACALQHDDLLRNSSEMDG